MKHHFGDLLDRDGEHWTIVANAERHRFAFSDLRLAPAASSIITLRGEDRHWERISTFPRLEELTLHEPSKEQLDFVSGLWRLKRLRITHARPKSLEFLTNLKNLEELVLEYVSGVERLEPLQQLVRLRSLHLENLRRVGDFGGLAGLSELRYLYITGTLDWNQPIADFDFLAQLKGLEVFGLGFVRSLAPSPALLSLLSLPELKKIKIPMNLFDLPDYAILECGLSGVRGAQFAPYQQIAFRFVPLPVDDVRSRLPVSEIELRHADVIIRSDGRREIKDPDSEVFYALGKGSRPIKITSPDADRRKHALTEAYAQAKRDAMEFLSRR